MNCELIDYEFEKRQQLEELKSRFMKDWENYKEEWKDWWSEDEQSFWTDMLRMAMIEGARLTNYYYDDTYYRCGDRYGDEFGLLSPLSEHEFREKMREFALKNPGNYCHRKFLRSMTNYGIFYEGSSSDLEFDGISHSVALHSISESDIYTDEEFAEITRKREEEKRLKVEQERAVAVAKREQQEREQYEKLKVKFEQKGN